MAKKVRDAEKEWIPLIIVIGQKEVESGSFQARNRMQGKMVQVTLDSLVAECQRMVAGKPYSTLPLPKMVSQRPLFA